MNEIIFTLNRDLFNVSGLSTLILFVMETGKDGFVTFYFNPAIVLGIFLVSSAIWLFDRDERG